MATAKERKIDGKRFMLQDSGYTGLKARDKAKQLREAGYNVRIIELSDGTYAIYRRHKK